MNNSFIGNILSGLFGLGNTALSYQYQKNLVDKGYDIWSKQQANTARLSKEGMLNAGINPAGLYMGAGGWKASN